MKGLENIRKLGKPWFALLIALFVILFFEFIFITIAFYMNNDEIDNIVFVVANVTWALITMYFIALFIRARKLVKSSKKDADTILKNDSTN